MIKINRGGVGKLSTKARISSNVEKRDGEIT